MKLIGSEIKNCLRLLQRTIHPDRIPHTSPKIQKVNSDAFTIIGGILIDYADLLSSRSNEPLHFANGCTKLSFHILKANSKNLSFIEHRIPINSLEIHESKKDAISWFDVAVSLFNLFEKMSIPFDKSIISALTNNNDEEAFKIFDYNQFTLRRAMNTLRHLTNVRIANNLSKEDQITAIKSIWFSRNVLYALKDENFFFIIANPGDSFAISNVKILSPSFTPDDVINLS